MKQIEIRKGITHSRVWVDPIKKDGLMDVLEDQRSAN